MSLADRLTPRQVEIARLIARGLLAKEVAAELGTSYATVRAHLYNPGGIFERLGARSNVDVARAVWESDMGENLGRQFVRDVLTPAERDRVIRSAISSLRLSGIDVDADTALRIYERMKDEPIIDLDGPIAMSEPTEGKPADRGWEVREGVIHWIPEPLPAGQDAFTDYGGDDCQLRRRRTDERAKPVRVTEPLFPSSRVRVVSNDGGYQAVKER